MNEDSNLNSDSSSSKWINILIKYFITIKENEEKIEEIRSKLINIPTFNPDILFKHLDKNNQKYLSLKDFRQFLRSQKIQYKEKNLRKFIHNFDKDNDFTLNFVEFLKVISPQKNKQSYENNKNENNISDEIISVFCNLLSAELSFVETCYDISQKIRNSKDFTTYEAFKEIVGENEQYISSKNIENFLKENGVNTNEEQIKQLMYRIDADNDGLVSYEEFKDIFLPLKELDYDDDNDTSITTSNINILDDNMNVKKSKFNFDNENNTNIFKENNGNIYNENNIKNFNENNGNNYNEKNINNFNENNENIFNGNTENILNEDNENIFNENHGNKIENNEPKIQEMSEKNEKIIINNNINNNFNYYLNKEKETIQTKSEQILLNDNQEKNNKPEINHNDKMINKNVSFKPTKIEDTSGKKLISNNDGKKFVIFGTSLNYDYSNYLGNKDNIRNNSNKKLTKNNSMINLTNNLIENDNINNSQINYESININDNNYNEQNSLKYNNEENEETTIENNKYKKQIKNIQKNLNNYYFEDFKGNNNENINENINENLDDNCIITPKKENKEISLIKSINQCKNSLYNKIKNSKKYLFKNISSDIDLYNYQQEKPKKIEYHYNIDNNNNKLIPTKSICQLKKYNTYLINQIRRNNMNNEKRDNNYSTSSNNSYNYNIYNNRAKENSINNISQQEISCNLNVNKIRCPKCFCIQEGNINERCEEDFSIDYQKYNQNTHRNKQCSLPKNIKYNNRNANIRDYYTNKPIKNLKKSTINNSNNNNSEIITDKENININYKKINKDFNKLNSLFNLFCDFLKQDNIIENLRQLLSLRDDINLTSLFKNFCYSSNNSISSLDIFQTLKKFGLSINIAEFRFLFRKFDKNLNSKFDFEEFCDIFLPKKYSTAKIMSSRQSTGEDIEFSDDSKNIICLLFKNIIEGEKSNEYYRRVLDITNNHVAFELFNKIKKNYSMGIYKEDIKSFMKKNKRKLLPDEVESLMNRLDKNKDGVIDYKEFLQEITPMLK